MADDLSIVVKAKLDPSSLSDISNALATSKNIEDIILRVNTREATRSINSFTQKINDLRALVATPIDLNLSSNNIGSIFSSISNGIKDATKAINGLNAGKGRE